MFKVLQIDHVELFVPDRYDAARWYERVLGLQVVPECEAWAAGGGPLMISSDGGSTKLALFEGQPAASGPTAAFRRVAFRVTAAGFAEFVLRNPEVVTTDGVVDHQQSYSVYFNDPHGHQLEVTTYEYDDTSVWLASM
jgi:catechol 2,3-dioxygenase-like lactoylglutathione lyase family enzyme